MAIHGDRHINPLTDFGFKKLFGTEYEESLKNYRDIKNIVDTAKGEGKKEGKMEVARELKKNGVPTDIIAKSTGLSVEEIEGL